jgi:hypothetical protein
VEGGHRNAGTDEENMRGEEHERMWKKASHGGMGLGNALPRLTMRARSKAKVK